MAGANAPKPIEIIGGDGNTYVVDTWNRGTIADGKVMSDYTIRPICSAIQAGTSGLSAEIDRAKNAEQEISAVVSSHYDEYSAFVHDEYSSFKESVIISAAESLRYDNYLSGQIDTLKAATDVIMVFGNYSAFTTNSGELLLTDADVIKVLVDEYTNDKQVYYQWYDPASGHDWTGWSAIGSLDPYYSISEIDEKERTLSSTIANNYLSASTAAVCSGLNIVVTKDSNNPKITIATKNEVDFDKVSATTAYGSSAKFDNISSTSLSALSAKFTNISTTNISADLFKSDLGTVDTWKLSFNSANGINLTANNTTVIDLTAATLNDTNVNSLIGSAQSGKYAYDVISDAKFSAIGGTTTSTAYMSGGFAIKAGDNLTLNYANKTITLNAGDTGVTSISSVSPAVKFTSANIAFSAGNEIAFTTANNTLGINASTNLINSAKSGQSAYNWITSKSASLYPGSGINFYDAGNNKMGIAVDYSTATENSTTYVTALNSIPLSAGMIYGNGNYIEVNNSTKKINLSSNIVIDYMSATSAQLSANYTDGIYYNYLTPSSNKFTHGHGSVIISLSGVEKSDNSTTAYIPWEKLTNNYVLTSGNASGSKLSANTAITFVVTAQLPITLEENTYYIV